MAHEALLELVARRLAALDGAWIAVIDGSATAGEPPLVLKQLDVEALRGLIDWTIGFDLAAVTTAALAETAVDAVADRLNPTVPRAHELLAGGEAAVATLMGLVPARSPRPDSPYPWDRPRTSAPASAQLDPAAAP